MSIDIAPETERVVREELRSGHFHSVDDLILSSVQAWREREINSPSRDLDQYPVPPPRHRRAADLASHRTS